MGFWREWWEHGFAQPTGPSPTPARTRFSAIGADYESWTALVNGFGDGYAGVTATRSEALHVPALKRARDVLCRLGTLPIHVLNSLDEEVPRALLDQPERTLGLTRSYTMSWTIDDCLWYGRSLWVTRTRDYTGYPTSVERIPRSRYSYDENTGDIMVDGDKLPPEDACLFLSPNDGLLWAGGATIRALITLELTAQMRINNPQAREFFQSKSGVDYSQSEIDDFLSDFQASRKKNTSGFLPEDLLRIPTEQPTNEDLQLQSAREFSILECSRLTGLSPNWLAVPVTTRVYSNMIDERRDLIDFQASPYLTCIEERLSLNDVVPGGQRVRFNYDAFLRMSTTVERYQSHAIGLDNGFLTINEVRAMENRTALPGGDTPKQAPTSTPAIGG